MKKFIALQLLLILSASVSFSQEIDSTKKVSITLKDETEMVGYIIAKDSLNITFKSISGIISIIPKSQIEETKTLKGGKIIGKQYFKPDPADNRVMALPSGIPLKEGEVQFNAMELIFPYLQFGVTDFLSIGVGGLPFMASGSGTLVYYLSTKLTPINTKSASVSIGGAMVGVTASKGIVGIGYAVGTFGNTMNSVTLGTFMAFSSDEVFDRPAFMIGGQTRTSKSVSIITENLIILGNDTKGYLIFPSIGIRFSGEKIAADFGTYAVIEKEHFFYPIPWIGITYKF